MHHIATEPDQLDGGLDPQNSDGLPLEPDLPTEIGVFNLGRDRGARQAGPEQLTGEQMDEIGW